MPSSPGYKRNYKKEYANYHSKPAQVKRRNSRNAARNTLKKAGVKVAGKDVAHNLVEGLKGAKSRLDDCKQLLPIAIEEAARGRRIEAREEAREVGVVV